MGHIVKIGKVKGFVVRFGRSQPGCVRRGDAEGRLVRLEVKV